MQRGITQNIASLGISQVVSKVLVYAFLIMITRSLGSELLGIFAYLLNFIIIFDVVMDYGMTPYMVKTIPGDKGQSASYFLCPLIIKYSLAVLLASCVLLYGFFIELDPVKQNAMKYAVIVLFTWPFFNSVISVFQAYERQDLYGIIYIVRNSLLLIITYIFLSQGMKVGAPLLGYAVSAFIAAFAGVFWIQKRFFTIYGTGKIKAGIITGLLRSGLPFFVSTFITALYLRIDILMLSWIRGDIETGLFKASQQILEGLLLIPFVVGNTIFPVLSRIVTEDKEQFAEIYKKSVKFLLFLVLPISVFITLTAKDIIGIMYGLKEYSGSIAALQLLVWYLVPNYLNYVSLYSLYAYSKQKQVLVVIATGFLFKAGLTLFLVPWLGYIGSCYTGIASECIILAGYSYYGKNPFARYFPWKDSLRITAASAGMFIILWLITPYTSFWLKIPFALLIYGAAVFIMRAISINEVKSIAASLAKGQ
ncbi:hypothetical protein AMJ80_02525 [bacterium SM23_31]|nr:MAG: hypothetical protein AMJ80_02525 [bacterium SM23_31]